ncbi:MAG: hypothetical protein AAFY03_11475, partial [Pseudomonadota bacterium]
MIEICLVALRRMALPFNGQGAGALAPDAGQATGNKPGGINDEPDQRNWGSFGSPIFLLAATLSRQVLLDGAPAAHFFPWGPVASN